MSRKPLLTKIALVLASTAFMPMPVAAQENPTPTAQERRDGVGGRLSLEERGRREREARARQSVQTAAPTGPTPEAQAAAQASLTAAGIACQVTSAAARGSRADGSIGYEAACASGPGYIVVASTPPITQNCLAVAEIARAARAENPEAAVGMECSFPQNDNLLAVVASYAASAGVSCQVDAGAWRGMTPANQDRYEVGCAGGDGYWIDVAPTGEVANTLPCLEILRAGATCDFTTPDEQVATVRALLAGAPIPACDIQQTASKGSNANGRFYEIKCAEGTGYIVRTSLQGAFEQAYPCIEASGIAGGCTLVDVSASLAERGNARLSLASSLGFNCTPTQQAKIGDEPSGQRREVYEFKCSDRPLGLVVFTPPSGSDGAMAMDCLSMSVRGSNCGFTTDDEIKATMTALLSAAGTSCTVSDYSIVGLMEEGDGETLEVKCADGQGYVADFPISRTSIQGRVTPCAQAGSRDYECEL